MTTWYTADQHFGHAIIIRYCQRPFASVEDRNAGLVARWNHMVAAGDTVYVLGDFALGRIAETLPWARKLHGRKILIAGNHDRCWSGHARHGRWQTEYLRGGFQEVRQGTVGLAVAGRPVLASHFPYVGDSQDGDRFQAHRPVDEGGWLLHGHVHGKWRTHSRMINVGVDVWDYRPVSEAEIVRLIDLGDIVDVAGAGL